MTTAYSTLMGLAEPVQGELSGTWGDTVNKGITEYLDVAIAGTQTISGSQTAVTLSLTNGNASATNIAQVGAGSTGSAQFAIINCTGSPASLLTITVPASSRQYTVINATSTSQSVKIVGAGPTTGVTLVSGEKATVAWNGTDFVKIASTSGVSSFSAGTTGFTPNTATTGAVTLSGTLGVTNGGTGLSSLTASYIPYGNGTSAFSNSANFSYNGSTLRVGNQALLGGATNPISGFTGSANGYIQSYIYNVSNSASSSADFVAYPNNGLDTSGWVDMGITSQTYSDASYTVTGPNESYVFGSAPSGSSTTGNLVYATDSTGTANAHQWYVGGFAQAKGAWKMQLTSTGLQLANALGVASGGTGAASLTANNVILGNGTSAVQVVAPGTSGNVLTSNGTTWTSAAAASSGALILLATLTPTAAANVDFLNTFTSSYDDYLIIVDGVIGSSAGAPKLNMRVAQAGAAVTSSIYYTSSTIATDFSTATSFVQITDTIDYQSGAVGGNTRIYINNVNSASTSIKTIDSYSITQSNSLGNYIFNRYVSAMATSSLSGFRLFWSNGGNFQAVGKVRVYGIKNS